MSDSKLVCLANLRETAEALRGLRRQLLYIEAEAKTLNLEIVSNLVGAAAEEIAERLALNEALTEGAAERAAAAGSLSLLRH